MIKPLSLVALVLLPFSLAAQSFSAGLGYWTTTSGTGGEGAAHGIRVHGALGISGKGLATDIEAAFSQAAFNRTFTNGTSRVNENSLELLPLIHLRSGTPPWWPYAGPVVSVGIGCGTAGTNDPNGRVACGSGSRSEGSVRLGLAAGIAFTKPAGTFNLSADVRMQANTIAAARGSGPALLLAFELRAR